MTTDDPCAAAIQPYIDGGQLAGAVTLVARDGELLQQAALGFADIAARRPMARDSLFRIASLTKPVTSVAALTLYDEGRFDLDDPITDWAPEFAHMRVLRSPDGPLDDTVPAERAITFLDLLTHRSGVTYGDFHAGPIAAACREALGADIDSVVPPETWIGRLAGLPLIDQPGAGFHYGASTDLLGFLIARMEGRPLAQVLAARVFGPLGMTDTGFVPTPAQAGRRATIYGFDGEGQMQARQAHPANGSAFLAERPDDLTYVSGGAGLWSTADDYLKFARLFVGEGAVDGVRVLKIGTLRRMTANFLTEAQIAAAETFGLPVFSGQGFGLGVAVVLDPDKASATRCKGGVGTVGWPGAFGCWWQADPTDGKVMVFMAQNAMDSDLMSRGIGLGVFGAIVDFHRAASALI